MPDSTKHNIPLRVRNLIKKAGTNKPKGIADYLQIRVRAADLPSSINSFYVTVLDKKYICISDQLTEAREQNKAVCRGIGHFPLNLFMNVNLNLVRNLTTFNALPL